MCVWVPARCFDLDLPPSWMGSHGNSVLGSLTPTSHEAEVHPGAGWGSKSSCLEYLTQALCWGQLLLSGVEGAQREAARSGLLRDSTL